MMFDDELYLDSSVAMEERRSRVAVCVIVSLCLDQVPVQGYCVRRHLI